MQRTDLSRRLKTYVMSTPTMHLRGSSTADLQMHAPAVFASQVPTAAAKPQAACDSVAKRMSHPTQLAMHVPCMSDAATHGAPLAQPMLCLLVFEGFAPCQQQSMRQARLQSIMR